MRTTHCNFNRNVMGLGRYHVIRWSLDQLSLLKGILLTEVPQELKEPEIARQVRFATRPQHPQIQA